MTSSSQAWKRPKSPSAGARSLISHLQPGQKIVPVRLARGLDREWEGPFPGELVGKASWETGIRKQFAYWKDLMTAPE